ncbi:SPOR domain-containing protein [Alsobacter sp. R-9]
MTEQNRSRPVIDLDELERQLREAAAAPRRADASGRDDPLAELARIVGQDDPSRGSWRQSRPAAPAAQAPQAPAAAAPRADEPFDDFEAELAALTRGERFTPPEQPMRVEPEMGRAPSPEMGRAPAPDTVPFDDPQDWQLRSTGSPAPEPASDRYADPVSERYPENVVPFDPRAPEPAAYRDTDPVYEAEGRLPPHEEIAEEIAPRPRRKGVLAVATVLGVAAVGVAAALAMRGLGSSNSAVQTAGAPPVIKAEPGPMKVQPANPGGVEVPNQDRAIYTRKAEDPKGAKVVGGEEQPVDVAAKVQAPRVVLPNGSGDATSTTAGAVPTAAQVEVPKPPQASQAVAGLGEPRRVRTVSVRPDGTIIDAATEATLGRTAALGSPQAVPVAAPAPAPVPASPVTTGTTPAAPAASGGTVLPPRRMEAPAIVNAPPGAPPKPVAAPSTPPARPAVAAPAAGTTPAAPPKPAQVAALAPVAAPATPAAAASTSDTPGSGFSVQLAAPASEQEAKDTAARLQRRFAGELGGMQPVIRKAEVNGKTIYRVRVGSLPRDEATSLCERLKSAGGQCFVAKN